MTNRALAILACSTLMPLFSQTPQVLDKAFFSQDPKTLIRICAEESIRLNSRDTHLLVEYGDNQLALGNRPKAEEAFALAVAKTPKDAQTHHLIGLAWLRKGYKKEALLAYDAMVHVDLSGSYENRKNIYTKAAVDLIKAGETKIAAEYMEAGYKLDVGAKEIDQARYRRLTT
jgi:Flp pilus assembly protein TadD